jgi:hypothetical protein
VRFLILILIVFSSLVHGLTNEDKLLEADLRIKKIINIYFDKNYSLAEKELNKLIKDYPSLPKMQLLKGQILHAKGDYQKALDVLENVPLDEQGSEYWYFKFSSANHISDSKHKKLSKQYALELLKNPLLSADILHELKIYSSAKDNSDLREKVCAFIKERFKNSHDESKVICGK